MNAIPEYKLVFDLVIRDNAERLDTLLSSKNIDRKLRKDILTKSSIVADAVIWKSNKTLPVLIKHGADINIARHEFTSNDESASCDIYENVTALWIAAATGNCTALNLLLSQRQVELNPKCKAGFTPLLISILMEKDRCFVILFKTPGVDVYATTCRGRNGLMLGCKRASERVVNNYLAELYHFNTNCKTFLNSRDIHGKTALHFLGRRRIEAACDIAKSLLLFGAQPRPCIRNHTPAMIAARFGNNNLCEMMLDHFPLDIVDVRFIQAAEPFIDLGNNESIGIAVTRMKLILRHIIRQESYMTPISPTGRLQELFTKNYRFREPTTEEELHVVMNQSNYFMYSVVIFERFYGTSSLECIKCLSNFLMTSTPLATSDDINGLFELIKAPLLQIIYEIEGYSNLITRKAKRIQFYNARRLHKSYFYFINAIKIINLRLSYCPSHIMRDIKEHFFELFNIAIRITTLINQFRIDTGLTVVQTCQLILSICSFFPEVIRSSVSDFENRVLIPFSRCCSEPNKSMPQIIIDSYDEGTLKVAEKIFEIILGEKSIFHFNVNEQDSCGNTIMQLAINKTPHSRNIVDVLLHHEDIDIDTVNDFGHSLLDDILKSQHVTPSQIVQKRSLKCIAAKECSKLSWDQIETLGQSLKSVVVSHGFRDDQYE